MKESSAPGLPTKPRILRISPLWKLDERKFQFDSTFLKIGRWTDEFDIGSLIWKKIHEFGIRISPGSENPYVREFEKSTRAFADSDKELPSAEDLFVAFVWLNAVCEEFMAGFPNWKISPSMGLLHQINRFDANDIDLPDLFEIDRGFFEDPLFRLVFSEIKNACELQEYHSIVMDFFWPAGLYQVIPLAKRFKELGKRVVLDFSKSNEQADFTQWITAFEENPEIFEFVDAITVYEDYGHALGMILEAFSHGKEIPQDLENVVCLREWTPSFQKPKAISEETLFERFVQYFHKKPRERKIFGKRISTLRLFPYKCYWSSCFFCTINSTHLYPYKQEGSRYLDACLDYVEKYGIEYLYLADEAIKSEDILEFARKILERGLSLTYRFRTRFDSAYDAAACRILHESGARYVWIGLECASDRVSDLINKGSEMPLKKKMEIILNFESAGIPFHNYAILWLPWERQDEMYETFLFLSKNIRERDNYTCSPNVFGLNRGSVYEKHGERFGIQISRDKPDAASLKLRLEMIRSKVFSQAQQKFANEIHRLQFLEFVNPNAIPENFPKDFWDFIDRTGIFYHLKSFFRESAFRKTVRDREALLRTPWKESLKRRYRLGKYVNVKGVDSLINLATGYSLSFKAGTGFDIWKWNDSATLEENMAKAFQTPPEEAFIRTMEEYHMIVSSND